MGKVSAEKQKEYRDRFKAKNPDYNKQYARKYREENPDFNKTVCKKYREKETFNESRREYNRNYLKSKRSIDPQIALRDNLRSRIRVALNSQSQVKSRTTLHLLGCSIEELKQHLESKFESWMTWENYGKYDKERDTWHIDHIKPCSSFDLTDEEQQKQCFHYTNLQPLLAIDNIKKSNKF